MNWPDIDDITESAWASLAQYRERRDRAIGAQAKIVITSNPTGPNWIKDRFMNEQEQYWKGNDEYHRRSPGDEESNYHFFRKALACADLKYDCSIMEFGCGTGTNLRALKRCFTHPVLTGAEINLEAANKAMLDADVFNRSILQDWRHIEQKDLVFTKGLLIHISPAHLPKAYQTLVDASNRYVLVCEYFCPTPRMIPYRGENDRLWARDFAGEIIDAHGLQLVDYGFVSKRDMHPQDDLTWWLLEKP